MASEDAKAYYWGREIEEHGVYTKVLVPLDGSDNAEQALLHASEIARRYHSELLLLHVVTSFPPESVTTARGAAGDETRREEARALTYLEQLAKPLRTGGMKVTCAVRRGLPNDAIVKYAREGGADLGVLATHGRSGSRRAVMGSVADYVLKKSGLPMLLIRPVETSAPKFFGAPAEARTPAPVED